MADSRFKTVAACLFAALCVLPVPAFAADDDEPINLAPVQKRVPKGSEAATAPAMKPTEAAVKAEAPTVPVAQATAVVAATVAPTLVPTQVAVKPAAKIKPKPAGAKVLGVKARTVQDGVEVVIEGQGNLKARASALKSPDRVLVRVENAKLSGGKRGIDLGMGQAVRVRLAQNREDVWAVVDLLGPVAFEGRKSGNNYVLKLSTGGAPQAEAAATPAAAAKSASTATLPRVQMMLFDKNVMFQGKQYERFPCANLIYDKGDAFPLEREFFSTLVFSQGYGAFVGNLRVVGPDGNVLDQTREPFAFNLFNALTDHFIETPWKVRFEKKGWHRLVLTLNGEDALEHRFYVGHNDDKP